MLTLLLLACSQPANDVVVADPGRPDADTEPPALETDVEETESASDTESESESEPSDTDTDALSEADATVCYPGADEDWTTCFTAYRYDHEELGADYDYPEPYGGSANYREPVRWLDLEELDGSTSLAPNFVLSELAEAYKGRWGVVQPHLLERLQALRDDLGPLVVNSGYRPPAYNADVGGATYSRHIYGDSADLDPSSVSLETLGEACYDEGAGYVGYYSTHVHCDWRSDPVDEDFFGPEGRRGRTVPLPEQSASLEVSNGRLWAPAEGWDEGEPLREWTAWDKDGNELATSTGQSFDPPPAAASVRVVVGRAIERTIYLDN